MDFTNFLKHCETEHGIKVNASDFTDALLYAIYRYFDNRHGKTLLHTEQWDVLETLQQQPLQASPPPIIAEIKQAMSDNIEGGEPMEPFCWIQQHGVLISNADALKIVEFCERVQVVDAVPDYGTGFRPDWSKIDPKTGANAYGSAPKTNF